MRPALGRVLLILPALWLLDLCPGCHLGLPRPSLWPRTYNSPFGLSNPLSYLNSRRNLSPTTLPVILAHTCAMLPTAVSQALDTPEWGLIPNVHIHTPTRGTHACVHVHTRVHTTHRASDQARMMYLLFLRNVPGFLSLCHRPQPSLPVLHLAPRPPQLGPSQAHREPCPSPVCAPLATCAIYVNVACRQRASSTGHRLSAPFRRSRNSLKC